MYQMIHPRQCIRSGLTVTVLALLLVVLTGCDQFLPVTHPQSDIRRMMLIAGRIRKSESDCMKRLGRYCNLQEMEPIEVRYADGTGTTMSVDGPMRGAVLHYDVELHFGQAGYCLGAMWRPDGAKIDSFWSDHNGKMYFTAPGQRTPPSECR
jgi:hypothetical protein